MARYNLARTLDYLGDRAEAMQHYEVLVEQRPEDTAIMNKLADSEEPRR